MSAKIKHKGLWRIREKFLKRGITQCKGENCKGRPQIGRWLSALCSPVYSKSDTKEEGVLFTWMGGSAMNVGSCGHKKIKSLFHLEALGGLLILQQSSITLFVASFLQTVDGIWLRSPKHEASISPLSLHFSRTIPEWIIAHTGCWLCPVSSPFSKLFSTLCSRLTLQRFMWRFLVLLEKYKIFHQSIFLTQWGSAGPPCCYSL